MADGCVSSGSAEASASGLRVLEAGGNAADAVASMVLTQTVTSLGATCLGGEAAGIVFMAGAAAPVVICGQGRAPVSVSLERWRAAAPRGSIHAAATPALFGFACELLAGFGTWTLAQASAAMRALLREGRPPAHRDTTLRQWIETRTGRILDAEPPRYVVPQHGWWCDLAATMDALCVAEARCAGSLVRGLEAAVDAFYRGETAGRLARWYEHSGAFLGAADLAGFAATREAPVTTRYRGFDVHKCGPWTQGPMLVVALQILDAASIADMDYGSADYLHTVIEALKAALADRNRHMGDPGFVDVPLVGLLDRDYARARAAQIDPRRAAPALVSGTPAGAIAARSRIAPGYRADPGTVCCIACDRWGNMVAATPSGVGSTAGSGGDSGVTHGTRLLGCSLEDGDPNLLVAGKRPRTTLSPTIVTRDGRGVLAISSPGGDLQDQVALQLILKAAHLGLSGPNLGNPRADPVVAVHVRGGRVQVSVNAAVRDDVAGDLRARGHDLFLLEADLANLGGGMIYRDDDSRGYRVTGHAPASA